MLDLEKIALNAVTKALNSESLKEAIENKITETIEREVTDIFRSYSDFGKSFEKALKEKMMLDVEQLNFTEYNHWLTVTIKERFKQHTERPTFEQIDKMLNEIMPVAAETVSLDDLIEKLRKSSDEYDSNKSGRFAVCFNRDTGYSAKYITIGFDSEFEKQSYSSYNSPKKAKECECSIRVDISTHKVVGFDMGFQGGQDDARLLTWRHDFESNCFRMYAAGSVIDLGDYLEAFNNMQEGEYLDADDLCIENCYEWYEG